MVIPTDHLDPAVYDRSLPRKRMAAGVLYFDGHGHVLLVEPTYKPRWEIPGGVVERDESPRRAALREVHEELGMSREPGRVLGMDWVPARPGRSEGLVTIFDGGVLSASDVARIELQAKELRSFSFVAVECAGQLLTELVARRLVACAAARSAGDTVYLENGFPVS